MAKNKQSRKTLTIGAGLLVIFGVVYAFWPQPTLVDIGAVSRGHMTLTINEEARTRVRDAYVVAAPVAGRLLRLAAEPNDIVKQDQTIVARMLPSSPPSLDAREREQVRTAVQAAEASLRVAQANKRKAVADTTLATINFKRATELIEIATISQSEFEKAQQELESADAALDNATAAIALREAERANARAALIGVADAGQGASTSIDIKAPINGLILKVLQESEVVVAAGTPIVEIGNIEDDLEIIVELLSTDAVQVTEGDRVIIKNWGGAESLAGVVARIDPFGYTKFSALGVEEQRVNAIIRFTDRDSKKIKLGHGFRVEVQIVIWEGNDTVIVPSSALFRNNGQWAVFLVENGKARLREIQVEHNNGTQSNVIAGLAPADRVVLYPAAEMEDRASVVSRQKID